MFRVKQTAKGVQFMSMKLLDHRQILKTMFKKRRLIDLENVAYISHNTAISIFFYHIKNYVFQTLGPVLKK